MDSKTIIETLVHGSNEERYLLLKKIPEDQLTDQVFSAICMLLKDKDYQTRFWGLFFIIDKFYALLPDADEELVNTVFELLFDNHSPVADRSIWALSIIGDKALDKLIREYETGTDEVKSRIVYAIGRGRFSHRIEERIALLMDGMDSDNDELRFTAMCEMMQNTPISPFNVEPRQGVDYQAIYSKILPIAQGFVKSSNKVYAEFANRYIGWIG